MYSYFQAYQRKQVDRLMKSGYDTPIVRVHQGIVDTVECVLRRICSVKERIHITV